MSLYCPGNHLHSTVLVQFINKYVYYWIAIVCTVVVYSYEYSTCWSRCSTARRQQKRALCRAATKWLASTGRTWRGARKSRWPNSFNRFRCAYENDHKYNSYNVTYLCIALLTNLYPFYNKYSINLYTMVLHNIVQYSTECCGLNSQPLYCRAKSPFCTTNCTSTQRTANRSIFVCFLFFRCADSCTVFRICEHFYSYLKQPWKSSNTD